MEYVLALTKRNLIHSLELRLSEAVVFSEVEGQKNRLN